MYCYLRGQRSLWPKSGFASLDHLYMSDEPWIVPIYQLQHERATIVDDGHTTHDTRTTDSLKDQVNQNRVGSGHPRASFLGPASFFYFTYISICDVLKWYDTVQFSWLFTDANPRVWLVVHTTQGRRTDGEYGSAAGLKDQVNQK